MNRLTTKFVTGLAASLLAVAMFACPNVASAAKPTRQQTGRASVTPAVVGLVSIDRSRGYISQQTTVTAPATSVGPPAAREPAEPVVKPLNVAAATLFDQYVTDPAVRSLAKARFNAHHTLTRNDMLAIFRQAEKAGAMTASELQSLRNIVADAAVLHMADYVRDLSTKVLFSYAPNAHYQGKALGNLRVGSSAGQLELLVKKWFLGADRPAADSQYHYELAQGILYNGVPRLGDLHQGYVSDCFFLASLGEAAMLDWKEVASMFIDNGDKTFTVRFYHNGRATYVTVDRFLPVDDDHNLVYDGAGTAAGDAKNILWVALAEKAFVQLNESGWVKHFGPSGVNTYAALDHGGDATTTIPVVTGLPATDGDVSTVNAVNRRELTLADTVDNPAAGFVHWHTYAVMGYDATKHTVTLFNPWGKSGDDPGIKYGTITVSWSEFVANFKSLHHSTRPEA